MIRQYIPQVIHEVEIENKEVVLNEDPIIEQQQSREIVSPDRIKIDPENRRKVAGVAIGVHVEPIVGVSIDPVTLDPGPTSLVGKDAFKVYIPKNAYFPAYRNYNYDVLGNEGNILGIKDLAEDLKASTDAIADNYSKLEDELTNGWDWDSITEGSFSDTNALRDMTRFIVNPPLIAKYLSTLQANNNNNSAEVSKTGEPNLSLKHKVEFSPISFQEQATVDKLIPRYEQKTYAGEYASAVAAVQMSGIMVELISGNIQENVVSGLVANFRNGSSDAPALLQKQLDLFGRKAIADKATANDDKSIYTKSDFIYNSSNGLQYDHTIAFKDNNISGAEFYANTTTKTTYNDGYFLHYSYGGLKLSDVGLSEDDMQKRVVSYAYTPIQGALDARITHSKPEDQKAQETATDSTVKLADKQTPVVVWLPTTPNDYKGEELKPPLKSDSKLDPDKAKETLANDITNLRSRSIEMLLNSGADYFQHMFDVMLLCSSENNDFRSFQDLFKKMSAEMSALQLTANADTACFIVRVAAIDVPLIENDSYNLKFLFSNVSKTKSRIKYEKRAELKMLIDEPLIFWSFFNLITNNNMTIFDKLEPNNRYPMKFTPYSTNRIIKENLLKKKLRIDLIVKHQKLLYYPEFEPLRHIWNTADSTSFPEVKHFGGLDSDELPLWWFEDVNFLGQGSDLVFDRDASDPTEMSYPFIFKRCVKVNRIHKGDTTDTGIRNQVKQKGPNDENNQELGLLSEANLTTDEGVEFMGNQSDQKWYQLYLANRNKQPVN
jgi:hypothetical protein